MTFMYISITSVAWTSLIIHTSKSTSTAYFDLWTLRKISLSSRFIASIFELFFFYSKLFFSKLIKPFSSSKAQIFNLQMSKIYILVIFATYTYQITVYFVKLSRTMYSVPKTNIKSTLSSSNRIMKNLTT